MPNPIGSPMAAPTGFFGTLSTNEPQVGNVYRTSGGNELVWCYMGAVAGVPGKLYQGPAEITNHENLTPAAAAIGATTVTVTLGNTAAAANEYAGGMLAITVTPGQGYQYEIISHPAANASATLVLTLNPTEPIQVALTTSSRVDLVHNPFNGVIVNPTTATGPVAGLCVSPIAINNYGWLLKSGPGAVLADGTVVVGEEVGASAAVVGAVKATAGVVADVGIAMEGIADTEYGAVMFKL